VPVANFAEFVAQQLPQKNLPITYTVLRGGDDPESGETAEVTIAANPRERLGIVPVLGPVAAIQKDSPAEAAGLAVGDQLLAINGVYLGAAPNGEATWDPVTLDDRLAELAAAGETAVVSVQRGGGGDPIEIVVTPRVVTWDERPTMLAPISIPALGVACPLKAEVAAIIDGSPAQSVDLQPGDRIVSGQLLLDGKPLTSEAGTPYLKKPMEFGDDKLNWPSFLQLLQDVPPGTVAELTVERGGAEHTVKPGIEALPGAFAYARGIRLGPLEEVRAAGSFGEQAAMAWGATYRSLTQVVRFLSKIGTQVPVGALGGPLTILQQGTMSAGDGVSSLLLFLTMLSANLAVLNFLPIPVLDGGHMVFLAYEGLRGRPANERFVMTMQM
ncbi:MAG: site-2 protease family protein, partial [Planctomycetota bacterium]